MATNAQTAVTEATDIRAELEQLREERAQRLQELEDDEQVIQAEPPEEIKDLMATQADFHESVKAKLQAVIGESPEPSEKQPA